MQQDKTTIRKELLARRDAIPAPVRRAKDRLITETMLALPEFAAAGSVFVYASFRSEFNTADLILRMLSGSMRAVLPKVDRERRVLTLHQIKSPEELVPGYMGIPEPAGVDEERPFPLTEIDLVIVPGACFDDSGGRIGYGGGYYDRILAGLDPSVPVIAPAYEEQVVERLPAEPHDVKVHIIVTDHRVIRCR